MYKYKICSTLNKSLNNRTSRRAFPTKHGNWLLKKMQRTSIVTASNDLISSGQEDELQTVQNKKRALNVHAVEIVKWRLLLLLLIQEKNNLVVLFGTLKVQSFMLTQVRDCDLLIVVCVCVALLILNRYWGIVTVPGSFLKAGDLR